MKFLSKIFIFISIFIIVGFFQITSINAQEEVISNLNITTIDSGDKNRNNDLKKLWDENFFKATYSWAKWINYFLVRVAKDLKNLFFILATLYLFIIVIKLLYTWDSEEGFTKFKKWVIWTSIGIFVMQAAYSYVKTLYDKDVWQNLAFNLIDNIVNPLIWMLEIFASVIFLLMAIIAFYQLITANWNEETIKKWKMTIVYAIIWFILIKLAKVIVEWVYWKLNCDNNIWWVLVYNTNNCLDIAEIDWFTKILLQIINWTNSFVALVVVLMIIYAWVLTLTSGGDEEKLKKAKKSLIYIAIWLFILAANYLILIFFIEPKI